MLVDEAIDFIDYFSTYSKKQVKKRLLEILQREHAADNVDVALMNQNFPNNKQCLVVPDENLLYNPNCQLTGCSGIQTAIEQSISNQVNYATQHLLNFILLYS